MENCNLRDNALKHQTQASSREARSGTCSWFPTSVKIPGTGDVRSTFDSLVTVNTGWGFASRRTVTRVLLAVGDTAVKYFSSYHRLFSSARWSPDALGLAIFDLLFPFLGEDVVLLALDAPVPHSPLNFGFNEAGLLQTG